MGIIESALVALLSAIGGWLGGYFGAYAKKKGENYATKEDFDDLRIQQQELTRATKEVEVAISSEVWDRQRKWELKRDTLLEAARCVADVDAMLVRVDAVMKVKGQQTEMNDRVRSFLLDKENSSTTALNEADTALTRANMAVAVIGNIKVRNAFNIMIAVLRNTSRKVLAEGAVDQYAANRQEIQRALDGVVTAIRAELMMITPEYSERA